MRRPVILMSFLLLCAARIGAQDISVQATLSANEVAVGDQVTYSISVSGNVANLPQPQLPSLSDFKVYNAGTSQSVQFINGQVSSSVTYNYALVPVKEGEFTIGAAQLNYNGKVYQSAPLTLKVAKQKSSSTQQTKEPQSTTPTVEERFFGQGQTGEIFVRTVVSKSTAYVNEPVIFTYKLYYRNVGISPQFGMQKLPDLSGFWVEDIPPDKAGKASIEMLNGKKYNTAVLDSKVLFPTAPDKKYIDSVQFNFVVEDFFSFFGKRENRDSTPVTITALALPDKNKPRDFNGTVGDYRISTAISSRNITQNEPFSLKVIISGAGNIKSISDPVMPELKNFRIYDSHSSFNIQKNAGGVFGDKTFEYILIPEQAGKLEIPALSFTYFNYNSRQYQTLRTRSLVLAVKPGKPGSAGLYTTPFSSGPSDVTLIGKDIRFIKENISRIRDQGDYFYHYPVFIFLILLPLILLGSSYYYYSYRFKMDSDVTFARSSRAYRTAKKRLMEAERSLLKKDHASVSSLYEKAVIGYLSDKFNIPGSDLVMDQMKKILDQKGLEEKLVQRIEALYEEITMLKYSPASRTTSENLKKLLKDSHELINAVERTVKI